MLTYNFPLCVVLIFFPPFWTDAVGNVAIVVSFQKRSKRFVVSRAEAQIKQLNLYERKAADFVDKMMAVAVSREETKLTVKDPLKFWLSQVRYAM